MGWIARYLLGVLALAWGSCTGAALPLSRVQPARAEVCRGGAEATAIEEVLRSYGVADIEVDIPPAQVSGQERRYRGDLCFLQALAVALTHLFGDDTDPESPAALLGAYGRELLHREGTRLSLVRPGEIAPRGERVREAWLFVLSVPAMSDHAFWLVVERHRDAKGRVTAYTYGVN